MVLVVQVLVQVFSSSYFWTLSKFPDFQVPENPGGKLDKLEGHHISDDPPLLELLSHVLSEAYTACLIYPQCPGPIVRVPPHKLT